MAKGQYVRVTHEEDRQDVVSSGDCLMETVYASSENKLKLVYTYNETKRNMSINSFSVDIDVDYNEGGEHEFLQRKIN